MAGLRQLDQAAPVSIDAVEPQFRTKDLLIPVSSLSLEQNRVAVGRHFDSAKTDGVEEFIQADFRFCILSKEKD